MDPMEYDEMLRYLVAAIRNQGSINDDLRTCIQEQRAFNRQQLEINADVKTTLARIEPLLARIIPTGENGREA